MVFGGQWLSCSICTTYADTNCPVAPTTTVPRASDPDCAPKSLVACALGYCYSCNSTYTMYASCHALPGTIRKCLPGGGVSCGTQIYTGCVITTIPTAACQCPGFSSYNSSTSPCATGDCKGQ